MAAALFQMGGGKGALAARWASVGVLLSSRTASKGLFTLVAFFAGPAAHTLGFGYGNGAYAVAAPIEAAAII